MIIKCNCTKTEDCSNYKTISCVQCCNNKDRGKNDKYDEHLPYCDPNNFCTKFRTNKNDFEIKGCE